MENEIIMHSVNQTVFYNGKYASTIHPILEEDYNYEYVTYYRMPPDPADPFPDPIGNSMIMVIFCLVYITYKFFRTIRKNVII